VTEHGGATGEPFTSRGHLARAYGTPRELQARSDLYAHRVEPFDLVAWVCDAVAPLAADGLVVDVGCGPGRYLEALAARGANAVGLDLSPGMVDQAARHGPVVVADAARLPLPPGSAAVVVAAHMLYHLPDLAAAGAELARVVRPTGRLVAVLNGPGHLAELRRLVREASGVDAAAAERVNLDNAAELLTAGWSLERRAVDRGELAVPAAAPVERYVQSMRAMVEPHLSGFTNWSQVMARVGSALRGVGPDQPFVTAAEVGFLVFERRA
jgi:SAM-dependent methyltransferase